MPTIYHPPAVKSGFFEGTSTGGAGKYRTKNKEPYIHFSPGYEIPASFLSGGKVRDESACVRLPYSSGSLVLTQLASIVYI